MERGSRLMEAPISRAEHEEFRRRIEEENRRQDKRIEVLENHTKQIGSLAISVEKLAVSIESMCREQEQQGNRLAVLEGRDGEMWRRVMGYIASGIVGTIVGLLFSRLGM